MIRMGQVWLFKSIEEALRFLRAGPAGLRLAYFKPCISHPWRVIYGLK